jgi:hypothetical protein
LAVFFKITKLWADKQGGLWLPPLMLSSQLTPTKMNDEGTEISVSFPSLPLQNISYCKYANPLLLEMCQHFNPLKAWLSHDRTVQL